VNATVSGFDWDDGNRAKCQAHGVSPAEVEALFDRPLLIIPDEAHSRDERRLRAIGKTARGRSVFVAFTVRERDGKHLIRPITARYMHRKEVVSYEKDNPDL
jgi:uncharacterized DUF497 family protein